MMTFIVTDLTANSKLLVFHFNSVLVDFVQCLL